MANEKLRRAITEAGLDSERLADLAEVDVKTVHRWLSGRTPYTRHRTRVANAVGKTEHELWPEAANETVDDDKREIAEAFARAGDQRAVSWLELLKRASDRIDLLDTTLLELLETPGTPELLAAKGAEACPVRILIASRDSEFVEESEWELDPDWEHLRAANHPDRELTEIRDQIDAAQSYLEQLRGKTGVEIREFRAQRFNSILRFDDEMLVLLHLWGARNEAAPLLHLRHHGSRGFFEQFAGHYEHLWRVGEPREMRIEREDEAAEAEYQWMHDHLSPLDRDQHKLASEELWDAFEAEVQELRDSYEDEQHQLDERRRLARLEEERARRQREHDLDQQHGPPNANRAPQGDG